MSRKTSYLFVKRRDLLPFFLFILIISIISSFFLGMYSKNKEINPSILLEKNQYYDFTFRGELSILSNLTGFSEKDIKSFSIYLNRRDNYTTLLYKEFPLLYINGNNYSFKLDLENIKKYTNLLNEIDVNNPLYQNLLAGGYITFSNYKTKSGKIYDSINGDVPVLVTDMFFLQQLLNSDIILSALSLISKTNTIFSGKELIKMRISEEKLTINLDSLNLGELELVGLKSSRKIFINQLNKDITSLEISTDSDELNQIMGEVKRFKESTDSIAKIENRMVDANILSKSFSEFYKNPKFSYELSNSSVTISTLNICRKIDLIENTLITNYC